MRLNVTKQCEVQLSEVFVPVILGNGTGERIAVCQRDGLFEIKIVNERQRNAGERLVRVIDDNGYWPPPLAEAVRAALRHAGQPCSRTALRQQLRVNNARLGETLRTLEQRGLVRRESSGWSLPPQPDDRQFHLSS